MTIVDGDIELKIYKYVLWQSGGLNLAMGAFQRDLGVEMPESASVLSIQIQGHDLVCWALVSPEEITYYRRFHIIGTGHVMTWLESREWEFVTTLQAGPYVWHIWEQDDIANQLRELEALGGSGKSDPLKS